MFNFSFSSIRFTSLVYANVTFYFTCIDKNSMANREWSIHACRSEVRTNKRQSSHARLRNAVPFRWLGVSREKSGMDLRRRADLASVGMPGRCGMSIDISNCRIHNVGEGSISSVDIFRCQRTEVTCAGLLLHSQRDPNLLQSISGTTLIPNEGSCTRLSSTIWLIGIRYSPSIRRRAMPLRGPV